MHNPKLFSKIKHILNSTLNDDDTKLFKCGALPITVVKQHWMWYVVKSRVK